MQSWNYQACRDWKNKRVSKREVCTFLSQRLLPITTTWASNQGDQLVGPDFSLVTLDLPYGLSIKGLGTHLASEL